MSESLYQEKLELVASSALVVDRISENSVAEVSWNRSVLPVLALDSFRCIR